MPPPLSSKPKPDRKRAAEVFGHRGEALAVLFLRFKLYAIVARRVKTPVGEIDIIAQRGGVTVFIEVKARVSAESEGAALAAVNRRRIVQAARYYLGRNPRLANAMLRFDVIFLAPGRWPRHLVNAFDAS